MSSYLSTVSSKVSAEDFDGYCSYVLLKDTSGKTWVTGDRALIFRDKVLQKEWKLIASNVKKFNASTYGELCLGYIDFNDDLWVLGSDSDYLGLNKQTSVVTRNFVKVKDYLSGLTIYNNISGKVKDYVFDGGCLFILTNKQDGDTVYSCGDNALMSTWYKYFFTGQSFGTKSIIPTKIDGLTNVKTISAKNRGRLVVKKDNTIWAWRVK